MNSSGSYEFGCAHFPARQPVAVSIQESIVPGACIPSRLLALSVDSRLLAYGWVTAEPVEFFCYPAGKEENRSLCYNFGDS
jgi:hypothetical protein